jgi:hypothetical protein
MHRIIIFLIILILFSILINYLLIQYKHIEYNKNYRIPNTRSGRIIDSIYYTLSIWSTNGCNELNPVSKVSKIFVSIQSLVIITLTILGINSLWLYTK